MLFASAHVSLKINSDTENQHYSRHESIDTANTDTPI